jgi:hypothetical protein
MDKAFLRALIRKNPALFTRIVRFNLPGSGAFIPERLGGQARLLQESGALRVLENFPRGASLVRGYLYKNSPHSSGTEERAGEPVFFTDFQEERHRLALLGQEELQKLSMFFGAGVYAQVIARIVQRGEVLALRSFLGEFYNYALLRGRFQLGRTRGLFKRSGQGLPLTERIAAAGLEAVQICLSDCPQALRDKAWPFFPQFFSGWPGHIEKNAENLNIIWVNLKKLLLQELTPACRPFFA